MANSAKAENSDGRRPVKLSPMQVPKASDVLANDLRERILRGEFPEGTALPPERDLVAQTQMSRTTVREALRILEVQGLVQIRTGRSGGAFVQRPGEAAIANSVSLTIRGRRIRLAALMETREAIEPSCARLAARYRTDEDLEALERANAAMTLDSPLADFLTANIDWHVAVAQASHNELLIGFMRALSRAIYESTDNSAFVDAEVRKETIRAHRLIIDAIRDRDPEAAVRRMSRHVHVYADSALKMEQRTAIEVPES
jgi:DNA-binding FadR family transcriptional regulator|uniref:FadR family transcriptional regulator n=2 Tax=Thermocrispum agreste TaxID=37925 RepID=A0A2W4JA69_9PSEU|nr:MAG: FadR family transcriptional regulator [Thermocrispum agreste]